MKIIAKPTDQPTPRLEWDYVAFVEGSAEESRKTTYGFNAADAITNFEAHYCPCDIDGVDTKCHVIGSCMRSFECHITE